MASAATSLARAVLAGVLAACGAMAGEPDGPAARAGEKPEAVLHRGIDVSGHAGRVDWEAVARAGHTFAFVKATEGVDLADPAFDGHWTAMAEAGLVRGAYHFYVTEDDPEEQARFFISRVLLEPGDLAPVVDVELLGHGTADGLAERLARFLEIVELHYQARPILYTTARFWDEHLASPDFGRYPLWVAEYGVAEPRLPAGWDTWHLWQWRENAEVDGVEKGADLSHLNPALDPETLLIPRRLEGPEAIDR